MAINIICSLIASIIVLLIGYLWKSYLYIKIFDLFYDGVKIEGTWKATQHEITAKGYKLAYPSIYTIELQQIAYKIEGEVSAEFGEANYRQIVKYDVSGTIKDRFVCLSLRLKEKKRISHSNFLLEVIDGERMKGFMSFYALRAEEINSIEVYWRKVRSNRVH